MNTISSLAEEWEFDDQPNGRRTALKAIRLAEWITTGQAREWLIAELKCENWEAETGLLRRIGTGLRVRAAYFEYAGSDNFTNCGDIRHCEFPSEDRNFNAWFAWLIGNVLSYRGCKELTECWPTGDFRVSLAKIGDFGESLAEVVGLRVHKSSFAEAFSLFIPGEAETVSPKQPELDNKVSLSEADRIKASLGGRPPAHWWPAFAEELAVHIHDTGPPDGSGAAGQSELFDQICRRLAERGQPEPGRSTVQPVLTNVLKRIRAAGN